jgi:Tol biopolymer transport system component
VKAGDFTVKQTIRPVYTPPYLQEVELFRESTPDDQPGHTGHAPSPDTAKAQLARILASEIFAKAPVLRRLLVFLVHRTLEGGAAELKEYSIGVDVFDRGVEFDPRVDTIVRAEARRLRSKLVEYYRGPGQTDPILIDVPKGSYAATFRFADGALARDEGSGSPIARTNGATTSSIQQPSSIVQDGDLVAVKPTPLHEEDRIRRAPKGGSPSLVVAALAAGLMLIVVVARVFWAEAPAPPIQLSLLPPGENSNFVPEQPPVISPDGTQVALVVAEPSGGNRLYLYAMKTGDVRPVTGTDLATWPFWSPDSRSIGFFSKGKLKAVNLANGASWVIADAPLGRGASWSRNDIVVFSAYNHDRLYRVSAFGGTVTAATSIDRHREIGHWWPHFLPDGRHFLYTNRSDIEGVGGVYLGSLTGDSRMLKETNGNGVFAEPGFLLFARGNTLMGQVFDQRRLQLDGDPFVVAPVTPVYLARSQFSVSTTGVLVATSASPRYALTWHDRNGRERSLGEFNHPANIALSKDATQVLVADGSDLELLDLGSGVTSRLTSDPAREDFGLWSWDGREVLYFSTRSSVDTIWRRSIGSAGMGEPLLKIGRTVWPYDISRDGRWVLFGGPGKTGDFDIDALQLDEGRVVPLLNGTFEERGGTLSPVAQWLAYTSNEGGGLLDVYVTSFPAIAKRTRVSVGGGFVPKWNHAGSELFYVSSEGWLMSVPFDSTGHQIKIGAPTRLFQTGLDVANLPFRRQYDVSGDGQQFLLATPVRGRAANAVTVTVNWRAVENADH